MLFLGRIIQAVAGSAGWIVGFATLTDNSRPEHVGKVLGTAMSFVTAGVIMGPMIAGALLQLLGYWATWSAPFILLSMDFVARLLMIGKNDTLNTSTEDASSDETETLLPRKTYNPSDPEQGCTELTGPGFYRIVLCNIRVIAALLNTLMFSLLISGFDATLPLHLQKIFNWGPLPIGMIFLGIQVPGMILGPVAGWLRDQVGLRYPTTVGWVLVASLLCILGIPGTGIDWVSHGDNGKIIFIGGVVGIGIAAPLVRGAGTFQLIGKDEICLPCDMILTTKIAVTNDLQAEKPDLFGPHGGSSRIFSIVEVTFNMGTMLGPLVSGAFVEMFGFSTMVCVLGKYMT
jgi:MFS family permease